MAEPVAMKVPKGMTAAAVAVETTAVAATCAPETRVGSAMTAIGERTTESNINSYQMQ